jgi:hypothetical protein
MYGRAPAATRIARKRNVRPGICEVLVAVGKDAL